jgi:hypothetical protein
MRAENIPERISSHAIDGGATSQASDRVALTTTGKPETRISSAATPQQMPIVLGVASSRSKSSAWP